MLSGDGVTVGVVKIAYGFPQKNDDDDDDVDYDDDEEVL
jgi:hypothetical protein